MAKDKNKSLAKKALPSDFILEFASFLLKSNALKFGAFTLASGKGGKFRRGRRKGKGVFSHG